MSHNVQLGIYFQELIERWDLNLNYQLMDCIESALIVHAGRKYELRADPPIRCILLDGGLVLLR